MGFSKGLLAAGLAGVLSFFSSEHPNQKVCAQNLRLDDIQIDHLEGDWNANGKLGLGGHLNSADNVQTPSITHFNEIKLEYGNWFGVGWDSFAYLDLTDKSTDPDRESRYWTRDDFSLEYFPIKYLIRDSELETPDVRSGLIARTRITQNSPNSERLSIFNSIIPTTRFISGNLEIRLGLGGYYYYLKVDRDRARRNGFRGDKLEVESWGLVCRADAVYTFENQMRVGGYGELLVNRDGSVREAQARVYTDFPIISDLLTTTKKCGIYIRFYGEAATFDLGFPDQDYLDFDSNLSAGMEIFIELGTEK